MYKIFIKNMVCQRCILAVEQILQKNDLEYIDINLGELTLPKEITLEQRKKLELDLEELGFELIDNKKSQTIEKIKNIIIDIVHFKDGEHNKNLSTLLSEVLHSDYNYLSNLFSEVEGITIEKYYIAQKIEKVKELLVYDELSLSEIAYKLNYSSVAHLSNQFKKVTGLPPSRFKQIKELKRKPLDKL